MAVTTMLHVLENDEDARKAVLEHLKMASSEVATVDGGRWVSFPDFVKFADTTMSDRLDTGEAIKACKKMRMPVSAGVKRKNFEEVKVDTWGRGNNETADGKVRQAANSCRFYEENGNRYYIYLSPGPKSIASCAKYVREDLDVPQSQIRTSEQMPGCLMINFQDASLPSEPDEDDD